MDLRNYQQIAHFIHFRRHVVAPLEVSYPVTTIELKTANILREKPGKWGPLYTTTTILNRGNNRRSGGLCQSRLRSGIIRYDFGSSLVEVARPNPACRGTLARRVVDDILSKHQCYAIKPHVVLFQKVMTELGLFVANIVLVAYEGPSGQRFGHSHFLICNEEL